MHGEHHELTVDINSVLEDHDHYDWKHHDDGLHDCHCYYDVQRCRFSYGTGSGG